ncbi:hypothetical protein [Actinomyces capricornis]|uniref:Resolvase/invertase-type recombinase catalytic domain-containing protein n=1 Tax=Actinomyces capricornis TaxID=2755559 RepID=A0ABN6KC56_9ACTO|nr:hypothetical protein [Actinomyces capricornis]BDA65604.1 hypothetical protein MANAM107_24380 [Actinomyces capricornis]
MPGTTPTESSIEGVVIYAHGQYPAQITRQSTALRRYCRHAGLAVITEFHDLEDRTIGLDMALRAVREPCVRYLCTTNWPTANLDAEAALSITELLNHDHISLLTIHDQAPQDQPHRHTTSHRAVGDPRSRPVDQRPFTPATSTGRRPS